MDFRFLGLRLNLRQRKAFILIAFLIASSIFVKSLVHNFFGHLPYSFTDDEKAKLELLNAINENINFAYHNKRIYRPHYKEYKTSKESHYTDDKKWFKFDPNQSTEEELRKLPLPEYIINNIIKYRKTGARFKNHEHFNKIYGIAPYFEELKPFLQIETSESLSTIDEKKKSDSLSSLLPNPGFVNQKKDTFSQIYFTDNKLKSKKEKNVVVEINSASEYELMLIQGIGKWYSKKLIETRDKFGGFLSKDQIYEFSDIPTDHLDSIIQNLTIDIAAIKKLKINSALTQEIYQHPYLSGKQAKILILYRENHKGIKNADDLRNIKIFTEEEVQRLLPYMDFSI